MNTKGNIFYYAICCICLFYILRNGVGAARKNEKLVPVGPVNVTVQAINSTAILVRWKLLSPEQADKGWKYQCEMRRLAIRYRKNGSNGRKYQRVRLEPTATRALLTDLRAGRVYVVRVTGTDCYGKRHHTKKTTVRTPPKHGNVTIRDPAELLPGMPRNFKLEANATWIVATWEQPLEGAAIGRYVLHYGQRFPQVEKTTSGNATNFTITELRPNSEYVVRLQAENEVGFGPPITQIVRTMEKPDPTISEKTPPGPPRVVRTRTLPTAIMVTWKEPETNVLVRGYTLEYGEEYPKLTQTILGDARVMHINELQPGTQYMIRLSAFNNAGRGQSVTDLVYTRPQLGTTVSPLMPPVGVEAKPLSPTSAHVSWTDPALGESQKTQEGRSYTVRYRPVNTTEFSQVKVSYLHVTLDDLTPNTHYDVQVRSSSAKRSPWSVTALFKTYEALPDTPPENLTVVYDATSRCFEISWEAPRRPNGPITGYVVRIEQTPEGNFSMMPFTETSGRICQLRTNTTYRLDVQSRSALGYGPRSVPITKHTTLQIIEDGPMLPPPPVNVNTTSGDTWIQVTWEVPRGPDLTRIFLVGLVRGSLTKQARLGPRVKEYTFTGLEPGSRYDISLRAINEVGQGPPYKKVVYTDVPKITTTEMPVTTVPPVTAKIRATKPPRTESFRSPSNSSGSEVSFQSVIRHTVTAAISWSHPECIPGECEYRVRYRREGEKYVSYMQVTGQMALLTDLKPDSRYQVHISWNRGATWSDAYILNTKDAID